MSTTWALKDIPDLFPNQVIDPLHFDFLCQLHPGTLLITDNSAVRCSVSFNKAISFIEESRVFQCNARTVCKRTQQPDI
jgi:hypothetical protein